MLSDLFWNEHKTTLTCLGKITMGSIPMRLRKGIWRELWAFWWEWSALLRLFMRTMIRRVKNWRIPLKLVMTSIQNDCTQPISDDDQHIWKKNKVIQMQLMPWIDSPSVTSDKNCMKKKTCKHRSCNKVNRCLARYSPRSTTTNQPTKRAPYEPAWPGPKWPKMQILGKIVF